MKIVIAVVMLGILVALGSAGVFMLRKDREGVHRDKRMARALAVRVGLSVALFLFILLSYKLGWIQPTGLPVAR